jgi:thiol-disulfide isomerase/thioredoxin
VKPATAAARPPAPAPLVGPVTRHDLREYAPWQTVLAQVYTPDTAVAQSIRPLARDITVFAIVATWCPDTKRELPRFFAIMEAAGLPETALTMVGVDRTKKDAEGMTEKLGITRVPTFVFLRNGEEIGRFVEKVPPGSSLEQEVERILTAPRK